MRSSRAALPWKSCAIHGCGAVLAGGTGLCPCPCHDYHPLFDLILTSNGKHPIPARDHKTPLVNPGRNVYSAHLSGPDAAETNGLSPPRAIDPIHSAISGCVTSVLCQRVCLVRGLHDAAQEAKGRTKPSRLGCRLGFPRVAAQVGRGHLYESRRCCSNPPPPHKVYYDAITVIDMLIEWRPRVVHRHVFG